MMTIYLRKQILRVGSENPDQIRSSKQREFVLVVVYSKSFQNTNLVHNSSNIQQYIYML